MALNNINNYVISSDKADVTGDGIIDTVSLVGYKEKPDDIFIRNITLLMEDGNTKQTISVSFSNNAGYNPRIFLGDFNNDSIPDVLISIDSGGSGGFGFYYIYSFKNNIVTKLFDSEDFNKVYQYEVEFREGCRVSVYSKYTKKTYLIDVSNKKEFYMEAGVYSRNCKLLKPTEGFVPGLNTLYPMSADKTGHYNLLVLLKIAGLYNADTLGYVEMNMSWDGNQFIPISERVNPIP